MNATYERPASISSYFDHLPPPSRLLLRVYTAEKLRHVTSHGTYCKIYVGSSEMVHGSGVFSHHSQKFSASTSSLLSRSRGNTTEVSTTRRSPLSMSMVNIRGPQNRLRVLKTNVQKGKRPDPVWNEKFDIPVLDVNEDVLSIRVKSARLMSSPAVGACSIPLKEFVSYGASTIDRWFDLRLGKKEAGRIRLQLRLVDASTTSLQDTDLVVVSTQPRNGRGTDPQLSILAEESSQEIAARALKKMSRRDHKYHRAGKRFDGRSLVSLSSSKSSSDGSSKSGSNKHDDQKRAPTITTLRNNSDSATSNESEPSSDISVSPVASERASKEDIKTSSNSMAAAYRGSMRRRERDCNIMETSTTARTAKIRPSSTAERLSGKRGEDDLDSLDSFTAANRWTSNHTQLSTLSSVLDFRESSRIDYDDDSDDGQSFYATRKTSLNQGSTSIVSSSATSTVDHHNDSLFSFSDSDEESEEDVEIKSEKAREHQRQQWQMEQRKMQLARIKEVSRSPSDDDNSLEDEEDESDDGLGRDRTSTRIRFTPTLAKLLGRESMNVLFEDEDDTEEEDGVKTYKLSDDFVPMLEACSPQSFDLVDSALRPSSFD